jgi:hypothetical protein
MVSFWKRCYFVRILTFHFKVGKPNESIDGRLDFFRCILARVTNDLVSSLVPSPGVLYDHYPLFFLYLPPHLHATFHIRYPITHR